MNCLPIVVSLLSLVLITSPVWAAEQPASSVRHAVVKLSTGCSGVCISDRGLVVTAKHCGTDREVTVTFPGVRTIPQVGAMAVYISPQPEGPVIYDCVGSGYPWVPFDVDAPKRGEAVWGYGYPGRQHKRLEVNKGTATGFARGARGWRGVKFTDTNFRSYGGMSGGPLVNDQGRVVGVLTGTTRFGGGNSIFISWDAIAEGYRYADRRVPDRPVQAAPVSSASQWDDDWPEPPKENVRQKPVVYVFSWDGCPPCGPLDRDIKAGHFSRFEMRTVKLGTAKYEDARRRAEAATGRRVNQVPAFWPEGSRLLHVGYEPTHQYRQGCISRFLEAIFGGPDPEPYPIPPDEPIPVPVEDSGLREFVGGQVGEVKDLVATLRDDDIPKLAKIDDVVALVRKIDDIKTFVENPPPELIELKNVLTDLVRQIRQIRDENDSLPDRIKAEVAAVTSAVPGIRELLQALEDRLNGKIDQVKNEIPKAGPDFTRSAADSQLSDGKILGMPGAVFHTLSTLLAVLTGGTVARVLGGVKVVRAVGSRIKDRIGDDDQGN